jgi:hypothetical protein
MGAYVPNLGFCQVHLADIFEDTKSLTIAHYELLAFIITFLFTMFLNPTSTAIHIFIDNQNAMAWSSGQIGTNDHLANVLTLLNGFLQAGFNITQTRSYIESKKNTQADQISRRVFRNSEGLSQFYPNFPLIKFLQHLVNPQDNDVSRILASLLILLELPGSSLFVLC